MLFLVDGTDKMRGQDTQQFFVQDAEQLLAIQTLVIYTVPLNLKYDGRPGGKLDADMVLPMIKLQERDGSPSPAGLTALHRLLLWRADSSLFASDGEVKRLVEYSGGHPRELLRMLKLCCEVADDHIDADVVQRVIEKLASGYRYFLKPAGYTLLKVINTQPAHGGNDEQAQELLHRLALLQYNDGTWRRSHPVVRTLEGYLLAAAPASVAPPDLWAWRGGVYAFVPAAVSSIASAPALMAAGTALASGGQLAPLPLRQGGADKRTMAQRSRRVAEIRSWLARTPAPPDELLVAPLDELGRLLFDLGDHEEALQHWRQFSLPLHRRLGDARSEAITQGNIADILQARRLLDGALRMRKEEQLPVFQRLGDVREQAVVPVKIGLQLLDAGDAAADEARRLLETAWADLSRMGLPEADVIAEAMRGRGLKRPAP